MKTAIDISQGFSFLPEESIVSRSFVDSYTWYRHTGKTKPILYVEGELPAVDIRDRVNSLLAPFIEAKNENLKNLKAYQAGKSATDLNQSSNGLSKLSRRRVSKKNSVKRTRERNVTLTLKILQPVRHFSYALSIKSKCPKVNNRDHILLDEVYARQHILLPT